MSCMQLVSCGPVTTNVRCYKEYVQDFGWRHALRHASGLSSLGIQLLLAVYNVIEYLEVQQEQPKCYREISAHLEL